MEGDAAGVEINVAAAGLMSSELLRELTFRRRGIATALLLRAAAFMRDELRAEFGLLFCRHEVAPVYARIGWVPVPGPTWFAQSSGMRPYPAETMILKCSDRDWPPGPIDLCGLPW
ncbi:MAG: hypothetical protein HY725_15215 [Candidatus Rokubacteria bacterium]|nr:hypothetical protein [Candidatus Rokubacteria bacterium]